MDNNIMAELEHILLENLTRGDHTPEPSSGWDENMVMVENEPSLNPDMKTYCAWAEDYEFSFQGWHFFAPHHIFRDATHKFYLLAQKKNKWMVYFQGHRLFKIIQNSTVLFQSERLAEILKHKSIKM